MASVRVGTSGFSYKEWRGLFYPPDLPEKLMLSYYASRFTSVEIDSTFYRMPSLKTLEAWRCRGGGPPFIRVGRLIRYRPDDVARWCESRRMQSTSDANVKQ